MMQVTGIRIERGQQVLVDGLDFSVAAGNALMLRGPNGSGKTTTIRMLCGLLKPDGGSGSCLGYDFRDQSEAIRLKTGYMTQKFGWYNDLSVRENLEFIARLFAVKNQKAAVNQILPPRPRPASKPSSGQFIGRLETAARTCDVPRARPGAAFTRRAHGWRRSKG